MKTSQAIKTNVLAVLRESNRWMTANELIDCGDQENLLGLTKKTSFRPSVKTTYQGHSHPVYRILTGMVRKDRNNVYSPELIRRVRKTGSEAGNYEYAIGGVAAYLLRCKTAIFNA